MLRTAMTSIAASACLSVVSACTSNGAASPAPTPTPTSSRSPSVLHSTDGVPGFLQDLSAEERTAYEKAVEDYQDFSRELAAINEAGRATPEAKQFFEERTAAWQSYWARLTTNEERGIQIIGMGKTLRTRPGAIRLDTDGGGEVGLRVCGVSEGVEVFQEGEPVPQPEPAPTIVRVEMVKLPDEAHWRVLSERVGKKC